MLAVAGEIAIDFSVFAVAVTVSVAVPLTPLSDAVTVDEPAATPVATPAALIVAIEVFALLHVTVEVTFAVELSLYVAVAVNCCVAPTAILAALGDTAIEVRVGEVPPAATVSVAVPLMPLTVAVIVVEPAATAVASPLALIVAMEVFELLQVAVEVKF
jgi:hypothetical protein